VEAPAAAPAPAAAAEAPPVLALPGEAVATAALLPFDCVASCPSLPLLVELLLCESGSAIAALSRAARAASSRSSSPAWWWRVDGG